MTVENDRARLEQSKSLEIVHRNYKATDLITVYQYDRSDSYSYGIYCALVPSAQIARTLASPGWDLKHGEGLPSSVQYGFGTDSERVEYLRFGNCDGIEPLVIDRDFHGIRDDYKEISEEFRLFHRLYHDRRIDQYFKFDDSGNETLVAVVEPNRVKIRLRAPKNTPIVASR